MKTFPQKCEWSHLGESGQVVPGGVMRTSGNFFFFFCPGKWLGGSTHCVIIY